jgi:hypothetical protein
MPKTRNEKLVCCITEFGTKIKKKYSKPAIRDYATKPDRYFETAASGILRRMLLFHKGLHKALHGPGL